MSKYYSLKQIEKSLKPGVLSQTKRNISYERWMETLGEIIQMMFCIEIEDGVDFPSRDTYDSGKTIRQAIKIWGKYQF